MKSKSERAQLNRVIMLIGFCAVIFLVFLPEILCPGKIVGGSDNTYHLQRIDSLARALKSGIFAPGIHGAMCYGYGYATGFFYPDLFLYLPAALVAAGMPLVAAVRIYLLASMAAAFGGMYIAVHRLTKDREAAFICSAVYLMGFQGLSCLYNNFSISNFNAFPFMPMAVAGIYLVMEGRRGKDLLIAGMCGVIMSHTLSFALTAGMCFIVFVYELVQNRAVGKQLVRRILDVAGSAVLVILLMCFYALPMLEQMRAQDLEVRYGWTIPEEHVLSFGKMLFDTAGVGAATALVIPFAAVLIAAAVKKKSGSDHDRKYAVLLYGAAVIFLLLTTCRVFWTATRSLTGFLQFANRLCAPAGVMLLLSFGILYSSESEKKKLMRAGAAVLIVVSVIGMAAVYWKNNTYMDPNEAVVYGDRPVNDSIDGVSAGEWLPVETDPAAMVGTNIAVGADGQFAEGAKEADRSRFTFSADTSEEYYDVPFIWYRGYAAETESGERLRIDKNASTGLVRVYTDGIENEGGRVNIVVWYEGTRIQKMSAAVSLVTICACAWLLILKMRKKISLRSHH